MHIRTRELTKIFHLSFVDQIIALGRSFLGMGQSTNTSGRSKVAVDGVSLDITSGERVGIIGENGAGKTTLLQMISSLAEPTSGTVEVEGNVNCIMTLGVGLKEELPGRENIYIDGETHGKTRAEVDTVIDDIIKFADIGEFIDRPVKTYSSGMKSRLAFATITCIEPEILIIDEALSAGDVEFSMKSSQKMKEIALKGKIVIIVSHDMSAITRMCNRCIWMDEGRIVMDGEPLSVANAYREAIRKKDETELINKLRSRLGHQSYVEGYEVRNLEFVDKSGQPRLVMNVGEAIRIRFTVKSVEYLGQPDLRITFERMDGIVLMENTASEDGSSQIY